MKIKLFIDASPLVADHFSGVGHYTLGMVRALDAIIKSRQDIEIFLVVLRQQKEKLNTYKFINMNVKEIPMTQKIFWEKLVDKSLPPVDLIIGNGIYFFPTFVCWPLRYSKSITTVHDLSFEEVPQFVDDAANGKFLKKAVRESVMNSNYVATVTNTMKDSITKFYGTEKEHVIVTSNAVDLSHFHQRTSTDIMKVLSKYKIQGNYILCVGNIEPRKNQETVLRSFEKLPKNIIDNMSVVLVGAGGWKNANIYKLVSQLTKKGYKIVVLENKVTDEEMPMIYSGALAMVNVSFYEGFGMPTIEAMACKVPVIVSDIPVMHEVAGKSAIYANPYDVSSVRDAILRILNMDDTTRSNLIDANYKKAELYRWEDSARTLLDSVKHLF